MCIQIKPIPRDVIDEIIREVEINNTFNYMPDWPAVRPSAFPKSELGLILPEDGHMISGTKTWGYQPAWSKQPIVNTRVDTAMNPEKKLWRESILERRCVIPTFGFYEPHQHEKTISKKTGKPISQQYFFETHDSPVTFIGGIFEDDRFSMMTTEPSASMKPIHNRMPLVLREDELKVWLFGDFPSLFDRSSIILDATKVD